MEHLLADTHRRLAQGESVVLATICGHSGSTPRSSGAGMVVLQDGSIMGSIGGGQVEGKSIEIAMGLHQGEPEAALVRRFTLSNSMAAKSDMICGGHFDVLLQHISPSEQARMLFKAAAAAVTKGRRVVLVTQLEVCGEEGGSDMKVVSRWMVSHDTPFRESMSEGLAQMAREAADSGEARLFEYEGRRYLVEPQVEPGTLVLAGAGHVSLHTARLAAKVGFRVVVMDDRPEFANRQRFRSASQVLVLDSFEYWLGHVPVDVNTYVAILTRGHLHDKTVLGQALLTPATYIGMIGSVAKRKQVFAELMQEGLPEEELARVHCPIGLGIGAETPEEIAVSIVAELIRTRALRRGTSKRVE